MINIAILYHSEKGRTKIVAEEIGKGAMVGGAEVHLISVIAEIDWDLLHRCDALVFGSPTYMGSVSAPFKKFMDDSGNVWMKHVWKDKIAAGFTNSHSYSGDKLNVLVQMAIFAAQHGMIWVGSGDMPTGSTPDDLNRLGSFMGVMTQSDTAIAIDPPPLGDRKTAFNYGMRIAEMAKKLLG
ncbi:MAG: NADPH-dependent reductase [Alphaproteobacteria bacterium]|nr:NADPH-dependent reductase [Alphaproteobacteria bacterium]